MPTHSNIRINDDDGNSHGGVFNGHVAVAAVVTHDLDLDSAVLQVGVVVWILELELARLC